MVTDQFIVFQLGTEEFAIEITEVQEIIKPQGVTQVPQAAEFIEGIINLRGEIIVIIDLRKRLDFEIDDKQETRVIIVNINDVQVGFIVDDSSEVVRINEDQISKPTNKISGFKSEFLNGIAKLEDRLILLLNMEKLLSTTERAKIEEIADNNS